MDKTSIVEDYIDEVCGLNVGIENPLLVMQRQSTEVLNGENHQLSTDRVVEKHDTSISDKVIGAMMAEAKLMCVS